MKKILVPTDFSKCASNAFRFALEIATRTGASIQVLYVVFPNEGVDNNLYNSFWVDDYMAQRKKEISNWIRRNRKSAEHKKVDVSGESVVGFPVPSITEAAEASGADLIVMGTTGSTGLRGVFLGSVASGVLGKTLIPVLAVPAKAGFQPGANAVFATDFRFKVYEGSVDVLRTLLDLLQSDLRLLHILDKPGEQPDPAREATLRSKLTGIRHDFHYLHDRDVPQAISNFIEAVDAGLVIAVAHHHTVLHRLFFDSITRRLAHRTKAPLLVLHDDKPE